MHTTNPTAAPMTVRSMALLVLLSVMFYALIRNTVGIPTSSDLRSLWLAGTHFLTGDIGAVYRLSDSVFSMMPPDLWIAETQAQGLETAVYPFIYPPLWAWIMSSVAPVTSMYEFGRIMGIVNPCLLILSALLALRITAPVMPRPAFFAIALIIMATNIVFLLALAENQPQIIVAFFTLLGIERARHGSPMAGGLAMAIAASLKVYPVIFALIWLVSGDRRATASFALFGSALGLLSIYLSGWPMHMAFLSELSAISKTVLLSRANFSIDPLIGALMLPLDALQPVDTSATGGTTNWNYVAKSASWRMFSTVLQIATLAFLLLLARRTKMNDPLLWPFAIIIIAWVSPLSWLYHYMTAFLFIPAFFDRLGTSKGLVMLVLVLTPTSYILFLLDILSGLDTATVAIINNAALLLAASLFLWLSWRGKRSIPRPR